MASILKHTFPIILNKYCLFSCNVLRDNLSIYQSTYLSIYQNLFIYARARVCVCVCVCVRARAYVCACGMYESDGYEYIGMCMCVYVW